LARELLEVSKHQTIFAQSRLAEPASRLGIFEKPLRRFGNCEWLRLRLFGRRVPRSARFSFVYLQLRALPDGSVKALAEESVAALALDMNRTGAAPIGSVVSRFVRGTAGPVQGKMLSTVPVYRNEARIYYEFPDAEF
jgi:hypothetical protein